MNIQQGLNSLLQEVEAVLKSGDLAPQRLPYFEGARDYLTTLKRITNSASQTEKKPQKAKPSHGAVGQDAAPRSPPRLG